MNDSSPPPNTELGDTPSKTPDSDIADFAQDLKTSKAPIAALLRPLPEEAITSIEEQVLRPAPNDAKINNVVPLRPRMKWAWALSLAAAAALVLTFSALWSGRSQPTAIAYSLEIKGDSVVRGDKPPAGDPVRMGPTTPLTITLAPKEPVRDMALRVLIVRGKEAQIVAPTHSVAANGIISIQQPAREALGDQANGEAEIVFLLGRTLPDDEGVKQIAIDAAHEAPDGVTVLRRSALFEGWGSTLRLIKPSDVEFAGCEAVVTGPACEIGEETPLRFWVPSLDKGLSVHFDGHAVEAKSKVIQGGTRLSVVARKGTKEATILSSSGETLFRLPLKTSVVAPVLEEAYREMQKNNLSGAEAKLEIAKKDSRPEVNLQALRIQARIERRKGGDKAKELLRQAAEESRNAGRISDEIDDRYLLAHVQMIVDYEFAAAKKELALGGELEDQCSERRVDGDYHRGVLAMEMGRFDEAIRWLRRSGAGAERLDLPEHDGAARVLLADVLGVLGRHKEARVLVDRALADASSSNDPCVRARFASTAAWVRKRAIETSEEQAVALTTAKEAADLAKSACPSALALALLNVAFLDARAKKIAEARAHLAEARQAAASDDKRFQVWSDYLAMDLDVVEKPAQVLETAEDLRTKGAATFSPELLFAAALNRARALDALGRAEEARDAFAAANDELDRWSTLVPLGEGRETFFLQQEDAARLWVDFLVRQAETKVPGTLTWTNAVKAAADATQKSLIRFFSALARTDFATAEDSSTYRKSREAVNAAFANQKPAPKADAARLEKAQANAQASLALSKIPSIDPTASNSLTLLYHQVANGWVGFALEPNGEVTMARLPSFDKEALTAVEMGARSESLTTILLTPFADAIQRAKRIRVPAHGKLRRVPFEALPWNGRVLSDFVTVTYGFDGAAQFTRAADTASTCNGGPRALLVTNPGGDLPGARKASSTVQKALVSHGWRVQLLDGAAATREETLANLRDPCTGLFHYDGHAKFEGLDGLRAALVLHDGTLTVTDILELPRVPEAVSLLGCATGKDEGLGLAQAFLVRGSREVLAAMDDVDDRMSQRVAEGLYVNALAAPAVPLSLSGALSGSGAALRETAASNDAWWLFRVFAR